MDPVVPFEWKRLLVGDQPPLFFLEIAFRIVVVYLLALVILSLNGKRGRRDITSFDMLIVIALGSVVGDVLFYPTVSIGYAVLVLGLVVVLERITARLQAKIPSLHQFTAGTARLVISDGVILERNMRKESLAREELLSMLRENGIENTGCVRRAYLEPSGELGIITSHTSDQSLIAAGVSTLPREGE